jgi:cyclopropane-fatty-acyl-phospholipid synthase
MPVLSSSQAPQRTGGEVMMPNASVHSLDSSKRTVRFWVSLLRHMVWRRLEKLRNGQLVVHDGYECRTFGQANDDNLVTTVDVRDPRFYRHLVFGGRFGALEAYIRGYWECDNLVNLMRIFCRNVGVSAGLTFSPGWFLSPLHRIVHLLRRNTASGSHRNIAAHYDLGNDFFSQFLDETMAYSCAIFPNAKSTLYEASVAKFDRICRKLELSSEDHLLEIGSGWGGFALHAAQNYGCRVTTTTISHKQYEFTRQQVQIAGLAKRITVLCEDYRALRGAYDKLVSVEMIEAVGYEYFDSYFRICSELLKSHGIMLLQAIVIPDQRFDYYRRSVDFIQRYIFPGGCLPSLGAICRSVGRVTDFRLSHLEDITPHYAQTLAEWRRRFQGNLDQIRRLGFSEEFIRTWELYFCYSEGGFRERAIGNVQILLTKPACRSTMIVQPLSPKPTTD